MNQKTVRIALRDAMAEEMRRDPNVFLMGEDVALYNGIYKVSQGLLEEFGEKRVIDTPITEYGFTGIGIASSFCGLRPIVEFMRFDFAMQAIDHIINVAAKELYMSGGTISCPIVFRGPNSVAKSSGAQHSQCFASWYAHCPGLKVVSPYTSFEAQALLKAAIRDDNPIVFLEHENLYGKSFDVPDGEVEPIPLDKAIIMREGTDITITAFSASVEYAMKAAEILQDVHGLSAEVINLISLRPIDRESIVKSVKKTGRIINVEEGWAVCGIGSEIISIVVEDAFDYLDAEPARICGREVPMPVAPNLEALVVPRAEQVVESAKKLCNR